LIPWFSKLGRQPFSHPEQGLHGDLALVVLRPFIHVAGELGYDTADYQNRASSGCG